MAFPSLISIETTYNFLATGQAEPLLGYLRDLIRHTHKLLQDIFDRLRPPKELFCLHPITLNRTGIDHKQVDKVLTPIIPVLTSHPRSLAAHCQRRKFMVRPIVAPTVPKGEERVRICLHAANTLPQVETLILTIEEWVLTQLALGHATEQGETQDVPLVQPVGSGISIVEGSSLQQTEKLRGVIDKAKL